MKIFRWCLAMVVAGSFFASACRADKASVADIREPAVAGKFYSGSAARLKLGVEKYLQDAMPAKVKNPVAIIVPHAGYIYSGQICADGFKQVSNQSYDVIVILGTNHTSSDGKKISLYPGDGFRTPLGVAPVDKNIISLLKKADPVDCFLDKSMHESEHSVEVMVPFVQVMYPKAKIVPVVVGSQEMETCIRFGHALAKVLKNRKALIVASSDLSHYPNAQDADIADRETLNSIKGLDPAEFRKTIQANSKRNIANLSTSACGEAPIIAAMAAAKSLGAVRGEIISYANSGDTSIGDNSRVVGYGAVVLTADGEKKTALTAKQKQSFASETLNSSDKKAALAFARETISRLLLTDTIPMARGFSANLQQTRGAFVTLKKKGELRGCIGHMMEDNPLIKTIGAMALQAAFNDRRFNPVTPDELKDIEIEISMLTPMKKVAGVSDIVVGRDGVFLSKDDHHAVFLPQVAPEQGWSREEMLDNLCRKSGLEAGCWKEKAEFSTFQAVVFSESQFK